MTMHSTLRGASQVDDGPAGTLAQRYRLLAEYTSDVVYLIGVDGKVLWISPSVRRVLGWSAEGLIGSVLWDLLHPDDRVRADRAHQAIDRDLAVSDGYVARIRHRDGSYRWMTFDGRRIVADGRLAGLAGALHDVTCEHDATAALAAGQARYRMLVDNSPDVVFHQVDGVMQWISPTVEDLLGWTAEDLVGQVTEHLWHPDDRARAIALREAVSAGGEGREVLRFQAKSGDFVWVEATIHPAGAAPGAGIVGTLRDVTSQVEAEQALRRSEEQFRLLAGNATDVVYLCGEDRRVRWIAPTVTRALGWAPEELVGTVMGDLMHPDDMRATGQAQAAAYGRSDPDEPDGGYLLRLRSKAGDYRWMSGHPTMVTDDDGTAIGVVVGLRDVDALVRAREDAEEDRRRTRAVLDSLLDPHVMLAPVRDAHGRIDDFTVADANPAACTYWDLPRRELLGARLDTVAPGMSASGLLDLLAAGVETGGPVVLDDFVYTDDANPVPDRHFDVRAVFVAGGLSVTWRDVTERQAAVQALEASEAQYRLLAENTSDVVLLVAPDDTITWVSPSAKRMLGWDPGEVIGRRGVEFAHRDDVAHMHSALERTHAGEARTDEYRIRRADGEYLWVSTVSTPIVSPDGQFLGRVAALRDVDVAVRSRTQLEDSEERFRLAMDNSAVGMCLVGMDGRFLQVNAALCEMFGRSPEELRAVTWRDVTYLDDRDKDLPSLRELVLDKRDSFRTRKRYTAADGRLIWGESSISTVRNEDRSIRYFVTQVIDITDQIDAERSQAEREELLRVVLDNSGDGTTRFGPDLRVEYVNRRVVELSGIPASQWVGSTLGELGYPADVAITWADHVGGVVQSGQPGVFEFQLDKPDGRASFEVRVAPEFGDDGTVRHVVATSREITARRQAEDELRRLATHDPLTGLANRTAILEEITRSLRAEQRSGRQSAVLMIDLDRFKAVNDSLGHGVGDELLIAATRRIEAATRGADLVGRLGGDEFVVVMRELDDPGDAMEAAWRLVTDFREPFLVRGSELFATASIGVTVCSTAMQADDALREADTAMFVAKNQGRDQVTLFSEDLRTVVTSRLHLEGELRHALERNQLVVWYQPEVDLATGAITAVEALLRWRRNDGEVLSADCFIDVAEETGLILDFGDWVLKEVCRQAARWGQADPGRALTVRVNVSALQLAEGGLIGALDVALADSGLDPTLLCIEITETALLRETSTVRDNLAKIRRRGIRIALDDFGTGYASLAYIRQYPVDVLKIDRSFVTNITSSQHDQQLLRGIVALADALAITVTAEGVENLAQAQALSALGCPRAQGFLYSPAVPPDQITDLLKRPSPAHSPSSESTRRAAPLAADPAGSGDGHGSMTARQAETQAK